MLEHILLSRRIRDRRAALRSHFDVARQFRELEESCVPSYLHDNALAAWVSWARLTQAARMYRRWAPEGPILDFGSATGEIAHLIAPRGPYAFVEQTDVVAVALETWLPRARRMNLCDVGGRRFGAAFALDSLEHNEAIEPLVASLEAALADSGVLIVCGPTENLLYRLGRRIAGFTGHYHHRTVWDIERQVAKRMSLVERRRVPLGIPLFSVTAWRVRR